MKTEIGQCVLELVEADITEMDVDAIVNAANAQLVLGGGVAGLKSIAFCAISTGIFGFPIGRCAEIMLRTVIDYLRSETGLRRVVFCLHGQDSYDVFARQLGQEDVG